MKTPAKRRNAALTASSQKGIVGKERQNKDLLLVFVFKCACHTNAVPKGLLTRSERVPPRGGACEVRTLSFWGFQCRQERGPLVASFMLALAPDIITSGKVPGQA